MVGRVRWRPRFGASFWVVAPIVVALTVVGFASGGFGGLLVTWAVIAAITSLYSLVTGRLGWASVPGRRAAAVVLVFSVVAMGVGGSVLAQRAVEPSQASAETPEAAPPPSATVAPDAAELRAEDVTSPTPDPSASATDPAPGAPDSTALALLATLPVKGKAPMTGYDRTGMFGSAWLD